MTRNAAGACILTLQQCRQPQPCQAQASLQHATLPGLLLHCIPNAIVQGLSLSWAQAEQKRLKAWQAHFHLQLIDHSLNRGCWDAHCNTGAWCRKRKRQHQEALGI